MTRMKLQSVLYPEKLCHIVCVVHPILTQAESPHFIISAVFSYLLLYYCTKLHPYTHTFILSTNIIMPIEYLFGILQAQDKAHKVLFYLPTGPFVVHKVKRNYSLDGML